MAPPKSGGKRGTVNGASIHNLVKFSIRASPLPLELRKFLQDNLAIIRKLHQDKSSQEIANGDNEATGDEHIEEDIEEMDLYGELIKGPTVKPNQFWTKLTECCRKVGGEWTGIVDNIWAFGPQRMGSCLLIDARNQGNRKS